MRLNRLLGTMEFPITTTPTSIIASKKYSNATTLIMGVMSDNDMIPWRRQSNPTSSESKYCKEGDIGFPMNVSDGYPLFYAKTISGSGTLEIEFWC